MVFIREESAAKAARIPRLEELQRGLHQDERAEEEARRGQGEHGPAQEIVGGGQSPRAGPAHRQRAAVLGVDRLAPAGAIG